VSAPVWIIVSSQLEEAHSHSQRLRAGYKEAFDDWALQVSRLQAISGADPQGGVVKEAEQRVAAAELLYRASRDRLTDDMT
jgi:hypothetical protein